MPFNFPFFLPSICLKIDRNGPLQQCDDQKEEPKKKRQPRKKRNFQTNAPEVRPEKVVKQKKSDKTETKSRVAALKKTLRRKCAEENGANMFEFLVNPHSYSQTIENLFDMSFIMKEGFAQMDISAETQQPTLSYVSRDERTHRYNQSQRGDGNKGKSNGQCIVKFNPSTFYNLIDVYGISESQIEREDVEDDSSDENGDNAEEEEEENECMCA